MLGGILTVADDLLKNDGKKFIEMMEQLAERRMAREEDAHNNYPHSHQRSYSTHAQPPAPIPQDEYDDEDDVDDEDGFDDEDYEEEDEEEDVCIYCRVHVCS